MDPLLAQRLPRPGASLKRARGHRWEARGHTRSQEFEGGVGEVLVIRGSRGVVGEILVIRGG